MSPRIDCTVTVPLTPADGTQPVDRAALAAWLRKLPSPVMADLAGAIERSNGPTASARVQMDAVEADRIRHAVADLIDAATNPSQGWPPEEILAARKASYGLRVLARAWDDCTGYDPSRRRLGTDLSEDLGNGYRR